MDLRRTEADRVFVAIRIIDELELRDGERILVRPIRLADGDQLASGVHSLELYTELRNVMIKN